MGNYEKGNWVVTSYLITYTGMLLFSYNLGSPANIFQPWLSLLE